MATTTSPHPPESTTACVRDRVTALLAGLRSGAWTPAPLEVRIAGILATACAGDGLLTAHRVRAALWEGHITLTRTNDGRFAQVLADLLPALDDPRHTPGDVLDDADRLLAAVASA